jgi:hypothetical protein
MQRLYAMIVVEWKELFCKEKIIVACTKKNEIEVICKRETEKDFREF